MITTNVHKAFFSILLATITIAFLWLIGGFLQPIFWATVLGIVFYPLYKRILARLKDRENLASGLMLVIVLLVAIIPIVWIITAVAGEAASIYARVRSGEIDIGAALDWVSQQLPAVVSWLESMGVDTDKIRSTASSFGLRASQFMTGLVVSFGQNTVNFAFMFVIMLYILFFVFRDGERILAAAMKALPLNDEDEQELSTRFAEVSRATLKGTAVIGVVQGGIGGIAFAALGIPSATLWGVVMAFLSIVPAVGPALVWMPATVYFFAVGQYVSGFILLFVGGVIISMADNVLRPILVGRDTRLPDYLVLITTLGGLMLFGLAGVVIGPVVAALFITIWGMAENEYVAE